jgi:hypothetical protein
MLCTFGKYDCARVSPGVFGHGQSVDQDRSKRGKNPRKSANARLLASVVEVGLPSSTKRLTASAMGVIRYRDVLTKLQVIDWAPLSKASKQGLLNRRLNGSASIPVDRLSRRWRHPCLLRLRGRFGPISIGILGNILRWQAVSVVERLVLQGDVYRHGSTV